MPNEELVRVRRAAEEPTAELTVNVIKAALSKRVSGPDDSGGVNSEAEGGMLAVALVAKVKPAQEKC